MRLVILIIIVPFAYGDYEYKVSRINYRWWDVASFPVTLHTIGYTKTYRGIDLSIRHGMSTREKNSLDTSYRHIESQLTDFWSFGVGHTHRVNRLGLSGAILYTEYKELGKPDTDFGYSFGAEYRLSNQYSIKITKDQYYKKNKAGYGEEVTEGVGLAITYK